VKTLGRAIREFFRRINRHIAITSISVARTLRDSRCNRGP
jgi:hypothetical protein